MMACFRVSNYTLTMQTGGNTGFFFSLIVVTYTLTMCVHIYFPKYVCSSQPYTFLAGCPHL